MDNLTRLLPLATVPDATIAGMYAEYLRREGIQTLVQAEGPGYGGWGSVGALPHRIFVTVSAFETARSLISETFGEDHLVPL